MSGCTGGVVAFDQPTWAAWYPEFAAVPEGQGGGFFAQAGLYLDNTPVSPVQNLTRRATILYMITSHIAAMFFGVNGEAPSPLVGRINNASQGSVSVATDMPAPMSAAWWNQTRYGALAWQALLPYRSALYIAAPQIPLAAQSLPWGFPVYGRV